MHSVCFSRPFHALTPPTTMPFRAATAALCRGLAVGMALVACNDRTSPAAPVPLPALADQQWQVHSLDGAPVPALIDTRLERGQVVQQYLDSSRLAISADGRWEQTVWVQEFAGETYTGSRATMEQGRWQATATAYAFFDHRGVLRFALPDTVRGEWQVVARLPEQHVVRRVALRRELPPRTVVGSWRAATMNGEPLPAVFRAREVLGSEGQSVTRQILIDSAFVVLYPNARYTQTLHFSEWEVTANGGARRAVNQDVAVDFGAWSGRAGETLQLDSRWVPTKRITGLSADSGMSALRLFHGIFGGDVSAAFEYRR